MSSSAYRVRRATIDDLPTLKALWQSMNIPLGDLERRITEFQVATDSQNVVVGAIGFTINQRHGLIHSEAFSDFGAADQVRPMFWDRIAALALNHGVARYWTREHTPFWTHNGLKPASRESLERLPEVWDRSATGWLTLQLKDEDAIASLDKEFDLFVASERRRSEEALGGARQIRTVIFTIVMLLALAAMAYAAYLVVSGRITLRSR